MIILAFETSHDDTSISVVEITEDKKIIHVLETLSQADFFKNYGGTIPELASRLHKDNILKILDLVKNKFDLSSVDYVAYTEKPGLIGTLHIGFLVASACSLFLEKPLIPVNHLDGHFFSAEFNKDYQYPVLGLVLSGGHSQFIFAKNDHELEIIGQSLDDAIGELFDKISNKAKLGFPGGPLIDKLCKTNEYSKIKLNKVKTENEYDLSFSGIKSQVINLIDKNEHPISDLICSMQEHAFMQVLEKTKKIIETFKPKTLIIGGGVSANSYLRQEIVKLHSNVIIPEIRLATDNAAMIALAASKKVNR
ncbi:tRNA (adenosine(37)-N6)-threonylcarbamoyltransferase complex transferase subunit TsaD [Mycoplasmopsis agassizii]|uniref:N(6)-L-threonylcarbamoyladenine synthase n=1 Tax=Mycoplasmopsis agassizii TaxID=33922 RepID=A0ABX4H6B5_9BACT|nr:tRNA (adenosine(37)-N6)-threonylcarbamoyltransferase complex transferase subunit TsaD [Mycoplasmopsis agassizii]PAF55446.1 tRNA (adenosine(37)-N6)-threonylcarbamoyltransferase complex transferase subunit TsaD [Mycoplasmopsis agassizii]SMC18458.1 N6-L-threonylcarbamoyladenine synthase [Mycoplasmopsis agassizii]